MKLLLYINNDLFTELQLPEEEFENDNGLSFEENLSIRKQRLRNYIEKLKAMFQRKLNDTNYEIVLIVGSRMNKFPSDDIYVLKY